MTRAGIRILAVSGSLRAASSNTAALAALRLIAPPSIAVTLYQGLRDVPPFDPDEEASPPRPVADLKALVAGADALVISSPEYARGVAGSLKNALDWLVGGAEMPGKPIALLNTSPRAVHGQAALRLTLDTMSARVIDGACVTLALLGRPLDAAAIAGDPAFARVLRGMIETLVASAEGPASARTWSV